MANSFSALIIGCGNIGGMYDLHDKDKVWTHAKAFSINERISFSVYDLDEEKATLIGQTYGVPLIKLTDEEISKHQIVSITSPTKTHYSILQQLIKSGTPLIICEKPVSADEEELRSLIGLYKRGHSKILVNYIRRFQPAYQELKKVISSGYNLDLKNIIIKYQRGFLNNASHAIDLLEFLFDNPVFLNDLKISSVHFDAFDFDPTLSGSCLFLEKPVSFVGVLATDYTIFEIELFFTHSKIVICNSGNNVLFYKKAKGNQLAEEISLRKEDILSQYMLPVVDKALELFNPDEEDNFLSSVEMNLRILKSIRSLKN